MQDGLVSRAEAPTYILGLASYWCLKVFSWALAEAKG